MRKRKKKKRRRKKPQLAKLVARPPQQGPVIPRNQAVLEVRRAVLQADAAPEVKDVEETVSADRMPGVAPELVGQVRAGRALVAQEVDVAVVPESQWPAGRGVVEPVGLVADAEALLKNDSNGSIRTAMES